MKLYATTTSERASKGQGGNKILDTLYTIGEARAPLLSITMAVETNIVRVQIISYREDKIIWSKHIDLSEYQKGNKQKGETLHDDRDYNINPCHCGQEDCPSNL